MIPWNNTSFYYQMFQAESLTQDFEFRMLTRCFFITTMITAVTGNLLVIGAISTCKKIHSSKSNWLLCNLAVADVFQGAIAVPLRIVETFPSFTNHLTCRVAIPLSILFGGTSNITILYISFERFLSIYFPFFHIHYFTSKAARVIIASSWLTVGIFSLISATTFSEKSVPLHHSFCRFPAYLKNEYIWSLYAYVHFIPIFLVLGLYGFILKASWQHAHRIHQQSVAVFVNRSSRSATIALKVKSNSNISLYLKKVKGIRIVSVIVGLLIVLLLPIIIIDVLDVVQGSRPSPGVVQLAVCMIYANSCANVFVYAGFSKDFRFAFHRIFTRIFCFLRSSRL